MIKEVDLQKQVAHYLYQISKYDKLFFSFHTPNNVYASKHKGLDLKRQGVKAGVPDIMLIHDGKTYGIELKTETGKVSKSQLELFPLLRSHGIKLAICRSLNQVQRQLEFWKII